MNNQAIEIIKNAIREAEENSNYWFHKHINAKSVRKYSKAYDFYVTKIVTLKEVLNTIEEL